MATNSILPQTMELRAALYIKRKILDLIERERRLKEELEILKYLVLLDPSMNFYVIEIKAELDKIIPSHMRNLSHVASLLPHVCFLCQGSQVTQSGNKCTTCDGTGLESLRTIVHESE